MKTFFRKTGVKITSGILCVVSLALALICAAFIVVLLAAGSYQGDKLFTMVAESRLQSDACAIMYDYFDPSDPTHPWQSYYSGSIYTGKNSNLLYNIVNHDTGYSVLSTVKGGEEVLLRKDIDFTFETTRQEEVVQEDVYYVRDSFVSIDDTLYVYDDAGFFTRCEEFTNITESAIDALPTDAYDTGFQWAGDHYTFNGFDRFYRDDDYTSTALVTDYKTFTITCYLLAGLPANDMYRSLSTVCGAIQNARLTLIPVCILSLMLGIILFCVLCCAVGRKPETEEAYLPTFFRLPTDVALVLAGLGVATCIALVFEFSSLNYLAISLIMDCGLVLAACGLVVYFFLLLAARAKTHTVISGSLLGWCLGHCRRFFQWCRRTAGKCIRYLPLMWKVAAVYGVICLVESIVFLVINANFGVFLLWKLALALAVGYVTLCFLRLKQGAEAIAAGDYEHPVSTEHLVLDFKDTAETLNNIQGGMTTALEARMRSERLKTELITNVSHDLKTPLTSIVSYVDLLKQEPLGSQAAGEYLEVLDRQSQKLKKLITDLVDASKASTGNITVTRETLDLTTLLGQALGEYREQLTAANITPVVQLPTEAVLVEADGRLLWRVLDNLLGNVTKYAMPGTRFYTALTTKDGTVTMTFRNISRDPLNVSAEDLTERFVQGDASRHTEGSGLGLSIARSLTEAMDGTFSLHVDGDLFKATIELKEYVQPIVF